MSEGLRVQGLFARHRHGPDVVRDVSFDAPRGQITALLGPNGAGKSTILKALIGLVVARGSMELDGRPISAMSRNERATRMAWVPQRSRLQVRLTARQVVEHGRFAHRPLLVGPSRADRAAVEGGLERAGASEVADRIFVELSGGEQQRVLLARALATGATTLLLDEPTAALDARQVLLFHRALRELAEDGHCVLVVMHGLDEVHRHADRTVLLRRGRVHRSGPTDQVVSEAPIREVYGVEVRPGTALGIRLPAGGTQ